MHGDVAVRSVEAPGILVGRREADVGLQVRQPLGVPLRAR